MYEEFYQLDADPFTLSPTGKSAHNHSTYAKARSYMEYALFRSEGIALITGQPGTGKTTLVKDLASSLHDSRILVLEITCQRFTARELMCQISMMLGIDDIGNEQHFSFQRIHSALLDLRQKGSHVLLILDEAQSLSQGALEQARLLSNYEKDDRPLIQIVLVGQPALRQNILDPNLIQLHQRIVASCELVPLDSGQTKQYLLHRLTVAGWIGNPAIDEGVFEILHTTSNGIPRWINHIGARMLLLGMIENKTELGIGDINSVIDELRNESMLPSSAKLHGIGSSNSNSSILDSEY